LGSRPSPTGRVLLSPGRPCLW